MFDKDELGHNLLRWYKIFKIYYSIHVNLCKDVE